MRARAGADRSAGRLRGGRRILRLGGGLAPRRSGPRFAFLLALPESDPRQREPFVLLGCAGDVLLPRGDGLAEMFGLGGPEIGGPRRAPVPEGLIVILV